MCKKILNFWLCDIKIIFLYVFFVLCLKELSYFKIIKNLIICNICYCKCMYYIFFFEYLLVFWV